jgi:pilus assembly protein CpaD
MKTMRLSQTLLAAGALLAAASAQAKQNDSVDSVNQPVVTPTGAIVPNCPNWRSAGLDSGTITDTNYGCAMNSNLAAMVADPMDLIRGKSSDVTDTGSAIRAIKAWREAEPTSKLWSTTTKESAKGGGQ